jgi:uncharacterized membrane protein YidH (DUF202 family)
LPVFIWHLSYSIHRFKQPVEGISPMGVKNPEEKKHLFDDPKNVKRLLAVFFACVVGLLVLDGVYLYLAKHHVIHHHAYYEWENFWGFYSFYGFVACVILVLVSKYVLRPLVKRREDYYDE